MGKDGVCVVAQHPFIPTPSFILTLTPYYGALEEGVEKAGIPSSLVVHIFPFITTLPSLWAGHTSRDPSRYCHMTMRPQVVGISHCSHWNIVTNINKSIRWF